MAMFSMGEQSKSKHILRETKFCDAAKVGEYFINPKIENMKFLASV